MQIKRETVFFLITATGITAFSLLQLKKTDLFYDLLQLLFYFLFFCTSVYAIIRFIRNKKSLPLTKRIKPLLSGLLLTVFLFLLSFLIDTDGGKRKIVVAGLNHDIHFIQLVLFSGETFKLLNSGPFGGKYYRGTYSLENDTLRLSNDSLKYLFPTLTLVLKETKTEGKYFESTSTLRCDDRLFVSLDNR